MSEVTTEQAVTETAPAPAQEAPAGDGGNVTTSTETQPEQDAQVGKFPTRQEQPKGPLSRAEARAQMHKERLARQRQQEQQATDAGKEPAAEATTEAAEPKVDEHGRLHDPATGKFVPKDGEPEAEATGEGEGTPAAEPPEEGQTEPAAAEEASKPQLIRVEVQAEHPIRQGGPDAFHVSTPEEERSLRALLNGTYHRRQEVESLTAERNDFKAKYRAAQEKLIQIESQQSATEKWKQTPEYKAAVERFHEIRDAVGEEAASAYWKGIQSDLHALVEGERTERMSAVEAEAEAEAEKAWITEAWNRMSTLPDHVRQLPGFSQWFQEEVESFSDRIARGHYPNLTTADALHTEFRKIIHSRLTRQPEVQAAYRGIQERENQAKAEAAAKAKAAAEAAEAKRLEDAKKQGAEEFKRAAAQKRADAPPNPIAGMGAGVARQGAIAEQPVDTSNMSAEQLRRHAKSLARQDARARLNA